MLYPYNGTRTIFHHPTTCGVACPRGLPLKPQPQVSHHEVNAAINLTALPSRGRYRSQRIINAWSRTERFRSPLRFQ